eukprot:SAG31_NODE_4402_length_3267_cov_1.552715_3_plen_202_part_00
MSISCDSHNQSICLFLLLFLVCRRHDALDSLNISLQQLGDHFTADVLLALRDGNSTKKRMHESSDEASSKRLRNAASSSALVQAFQRADQQDPSDHSVLKLVASTHAEKLAAAADGGLLQILARWLTRAAEGLLQGRHGQTEFDAIVAALRAMPMSLPRLKATAIGKSCGRMRKKLEKAHKKEAATALKELIDVWKQCLPQ